MFFFDGKEIWLKWDIPKKEESTIEWGCKPNKRPPNKKKSRTDSQWRVDLVGGFYVQVKLVDFLKDGGKHAKRISETA